MMRVNSVAIWSVAFLSAYRLVCAAEFYDLSSLVVDGSSEALAVSSDGNVVGGFSVSEAFRWTHETGIVGLGDFAGSSFNSAARGVSSDGSTLVGFGTTSTGAHAFRWTQSTGLVDLGGLGGTFYFSYANAVSSDGNIVVGRSTGSSGGNYGFKWTAGAGMATLNRIAGGSSAFGEALAVSADGSVVVGASDGGSSGFQKPVVWDAGGTPTVLGNLGGATDAGRALGISGDAQVIVGWSVSPSGTEAFRWTTSGGMVGLGDLPGSPFNSYAYGASQDGSIIVGGGNRLTGGSYVFGDAFIWDTVRGMRNLRDVLVSEFGLATQLEGWSLDRATAISADGMTIVGTGRDASSTVRGWVVDLNPSTPGLLGDYNDDGIVGAADYVVWRKNEGTATALPNDPIAGTIGQAQYDQWTAHFGETALGSGSVFSATVPEPGSALLLILGSVVVASRRCRLLPQFHQPVRA